MRVQAVPLRAFVAAACLTAAATAPGFADMLPSLLPAGIPGYDTQDGVTVTSRLHPELDPLGLHEGPWQFWPRLDESMGYTTNALPGVFHHGGWEAITAPSLRLASSLPGQSLGAAVTFQNTSYLSLPAQDRSDGSASAGWRLDMGPDQFSLAAAYLAQHEDRGEVGTLPTDRPIAFTASGVAVSYTAGFGPWSVTPALHLTDWAYGNTTILGVPASEAYRDRVETEASVTVRYEWAPLRNLLLVLRALDQDFTRTPAGQPTPDSLGMRLLAGLDDDDTVWHWRLLLGAETVGFASPAYARQSGLITEAAAGWSPSGLTTLTASFSRESSEAAQQSIAGMMLTTARLTIDHEYLRNLLLQASAGFQRADFFQGGEQGGTVFGLSVTWLLNRSVRLLASYDQTDLHGTSDPARGLAGGYSRGLGLITLRLQL